MSPVMMTEEERASALARMDKTIRRSLA